jgi:hypothetical protein
VGNEKFWILSHSNFLSVAKQRSMSVWVRPPRQYRGKTDAKPT